MEVILTNAEEPHALLVNLTAESMILILRLCWIYDLALLDGRELRGQ